MTASKGSLGTRLVLATLGFCFVFTLFAVAIRTWAAWRDGVAAMRAELQLVERVYQRTLSREVWELDREALQTRVVSAVEVADIGRVVLKISWPNRAPEVIERTRPGWTASTLAPSRHLVLTYEPFPGVVEKLGELALYGDERVLWANLNDEIVAIVVTQIIQSLLLAGLITLLFSRSVTIHVQRIAHHLAQLTPTNLRNALSLDRNPSRQDELTSLVSGINQLQGNLSDYLEEKQRYEHELVEHRDRLADLVHARTAELEAANVQLEGLSRSDALTGIPNRRQFDEVKEIEFRRSIRSGSPLSLLVFDIDYFKNYNDTYGHAMGDQCLRAVATAMRASVGRASDLVARIGGEEFVALLPDTNETAARALAEKVRRSVFELAIPHRDSAIAPCVTISTGVAILDGEIVETFDALFEQADRALYRAKANGRNQIALSRID